MRMLAYVHAYVGHGRNAGAESTLHDMLKALVAAGWECDVLINKQDDSIPQTYTVDGVRVIPFAHRSDPQRLFPQYDVVITHLECSKRSSYLSKQKGMPPLIQLVHNSLWQTEGYLSTGLDFAIYNTEWIRDHHEAAKAKPVVRSVLGPGVMDLAFRRQWDWPSMVVHPLVNPDDYAVSSSKRYVTLVNLYENKGPHVLYYLARENPDVEFLGVRGGYGKQEIEELDNVTIWDNQADARDIYAVTKVILMPSDYETYGRIAVEAAASGIPSITTPTPGLKEALDYAGNYVNREDLPLWDVKLKKMLLDENFYEDASYSASRRSAELWARSEEEIEEFVKKCEELATA